jgi:putative oxidoreductase
MFICVNTFGRMNTLSKILYTTKPFLLNISLLLARLTIGILLFWAGSGKALGWFAGFGPETTLKFYNQMGFSEPMAFLSIYTEFIGGFLLIIGLLTRPAAFAVMINMAVATFISLPHGLMGPNSAQTPLLYLIIDIIILFSGPMAYSFDRFLFRKPAATSRH